MKSKSLKEQIADFRRQLNPKTFPFTVKHEENEPERETAETDRSATEAGDTR